MVCFGELHYYMILRSKRVILQYHHQPLFPTHTPTHTHKPPPPSLKQAFFKNVTYLKKQLINGKTMELNKLPTELSDQQKSGQLSALITLQEGEIKSSMVLLCLAALLEDQTLLL